MTPYYWLAFDGMLTGEFTRDILKAANTMHARNEVCINNGARPKWEYLTDGGRNPRIKWPEQFAA